MSELGIESPKLRRLYGDWQQRRGGRSLPARADFDVLDLEYVMGDLNLLDVLRDPLRFRFRVHATNATLRLGYDLTGKMVDEYPGPAYRALVQEHYSAVVASRAPHRVLYDPFETAARVLRWEGLILPLGADGETVDMLMAGLDLL